MRSQIKSLQNGRNLLSNDESLFGSCISPLTIDSFLEAANGISAAIRVPFCFLLK